MIPYLIIAGLLTVVCYQYWLLELRTEDTRFYKGLWQDAEGSVKRLVAAIDSMSATMTDNRGHYNKLLGWYKLAYQRLHSHRQRKLEKAYRAQCKKQARRLDNPWSARNQKLSLLASAARERKAGNKAESTRLVNRLIELRKPKVYWTS